VLFTVEGRGEGKRFFSCTRTRADSFLLVWWKGGVERTVFLCHTHRSQLFLVWWQGGVERYGVFLAHAPEATVFGYRNRKRWNERCSFRTCVIDVYYGDNFFCEAYGTAC
jgi:hypothetical protein